MIARTINTTSYLRDDLLPSERDLYDEAYSGNRLIDKIKRSGRIASTLIPNSLQIIANISPDKVIKDFREGAQSFVDIHKTIGGVILKTGEELLEGGAIGLDRGLIQMAEGARYYSEKSRELMLEDRKIDYSDSEYELALKEHQKLFHAVYDSVNGRLTDFIASKKENIKKFTEIKEADENAQNPWYQFAGGIGEYAGNPVNLSIEALQVMLTGRMSPGLTAVMVDTGTDLLVGGINAYRDAKTNNEIFGEQLDPRQEFVDDAMYALAFKSIMMLLGKGYSTGAGLIESRKAKIAKAQIKARDDKIIAGIANEDILKTKASVESFEKGIIPKKNDIDNIGKITLEDDALNEVYQKNKNTIKAYLEARYRLKYGTPDDYVKLNLTREFDENLLIGVENALEEVLKKETSGKFNVYDLRTKVEDGYANLKITEQDYYLPQTKLNPVEADYNAARSKTNIEEIKGEDEILSPEIKRSEMEPEKAKVEGAEPTAKVKEPTPYPEIDAELDSIENNIDKDTIQAIIEYRRDCL